MSTCTGFVNLQTMGRRILDNLRYRASTRFLRAFYSSDIGIPLTQTLVPALRALCLRLWPAGLSASVLQPATDAKLVFPAAIDVSGST